jgi:hypothetical protein
MTAKHKSLEAMYEALTVGGRLNPERSRALPQHRYGDPSRSVRLSSERGEDMDENRFYRIKGLLAEWACYFQDGYGTGYPKQSAFANERVQNDNRSTETYRAIPAEIVKLNDYIENGLAPMFKRIINLEYKDRRPQKTKAAALGIPRELFSARVRFIHEQLDHHMFGHEV